MVYRIKCQICGLILSKATIVSHQESVHGLDNSHRMFFICDLCGSSRRTRENMYSHMMVSQERLSIILNDLRKLIVNFLQIKHVTDGQIWSCKVCSKIFETRVKLNIHRRYQHEDYANKICKYKVSFWKVQSLYQFVAFTCKANFVGLNLSGRKPMMSTCYPITLEKGLFRVLIAKRLFSPKLDQMLTSKISITIRNLNAIYVKRFLKMKET